MRLELIRVGLQVLLVNHYTIREKKDKGDKQRILARIPDLVKIDKK